MSYACISLAFFSLGVCVCSFFCLADLYTTQDNPVRASLYDSNCFARHVGCLFIQQIQFT